MTPVSYSACVRTSDGIAPWYRFCRPVSTSLMNQESSLSPAGTGKFGMKLASVLNSTSHCSAMRTVLSHASGISAQVRRISSADFR